MGAERVFVALGTNMGDRSANLAGAIRLLAEAGAETVALSRVYQTEPVGVLDQPPFLNQVVEVSATLSPRALLEACLAAEKSLGRVRGRRNGPRVIDCDLVLYGDRIISEADLIVPHPRLHERGFVLIPLADIAPDVVHPVLGKSVTELLEHPEWSEAVRVYPGG